MFYKFFHMFQLLYYVHHVQFYHNMIYLFEILQQNHFVYTLDFLYFFVCLNQLFHYVKMKNIIPDIFKLYDHLEKNMRNFYSNGIFNKKYGLIKGVTPKKDGKEAFQNKFYRDNIDYLTPNGFIYPILGAFRALLKEN